MKEYKLSKLLLLFICCFVGFSSCRKQINWNETYDFNGKEPYGTYLFQKALYAYFPNTPVNLLKSNHRFTNTYPIHQRNLFIQIGKNSNFDANEVNSLLAQVETGDTWILSTELMNEALESFFELTIVETAVTESYSLKIRQSQDKDKSFESVISLSNSFQNAVSKTIHGTLGDQPNLLQFTYGEGTILLHSNPLLFTNLSMLQPSKRYIETLLGKINHYPYDQIHFTSYIDHDNSVTDFNILWQYPAFKWAFGLLILGIIILLLFETKRRQRSIPLVDAVDNNTLTFIKTVGQLYYNEGQINNLAQKKTTYFLEYIRAKYYINTRILDEAFIDKLHIKSGVEKTHILQLLQIIDKVQRDQKITETEVFQMDKLIKLF